MDSTLQTALEQIAAWWQAAFGSVAGTLGGATAQALILAGWRGMANKADFQTLQGENPLLISMALAEQRKLVV